MGSWGDKVRGPSTLLPEDTDRNGACGHQKAPRAYVESHYSHEHKIKNCPRAHPQQDRSANESQGPCNTRGAGSPWLATSGS